MYFLRFMKKILPFFVMTVFLVILCGGNVQAQGEVWVSRPSGTTEHIDGLVRGGSQYVAVGTGGLVLTSQDGFKWTIRDSGTTKHLYDVTWNIHSKKFVAVGIDGTIIRSTNGINWVSSPCPPPIRHLRSVTSFGTKYIAAGDNGKLITSTDGLNWTNISGGTGHFESVIAYEANKYLLVGYGGNIKKVENNVWYPITSGTNNFLVDVNWNGNQFVTVGANGTILTSNTGSSWNNRSLSIPYWLNGIIWGNGRYITVGDAGQIYSSTNGINWTKISSGTTKSLYTVIWDGDIYIAAGANGTILTSGRPAGTTEDKWVPRESGTKENIDGLIWGGKQFVAVGTGGAVLTSPEGIIWTKRISGTTNHLYDVAWSGTRYVAVGADGTIIRSETGVNWSKVPMPLITAKIRGITWNGSRFTAVGDSGTVLTSMDGVNWLSISAPYGHYKNVTGCASPGQVTQPLKFVAVGYNGQIIYTNNLTNWYLGSSRTNCDLINVNWNGAQFVAVGEQGKILTSVDGQGWFDRSVPSNKWLMGITWDWDTGRYIVVGDAGQIYSSSTGITWSKHQSVTSKNLYTVASNGLAYVAAGQDGTVLTCFPSDTTTILFWQHENGALNAWYMGGPKLIYEDALAPQSVDPGWQARAVIDMNNDGHSDIVWQHHDGRLEVWYMNGLKRVGKPASILRPEGQVGLADPNWKIKAVYDLNQDGHPDIIFQYIGAKFNGQLAVWLMNGLKADRYGRLYNHPGKSAVSPLWEIGAIFDLLGDGQPEVIWQSVSGGAVDELAYWKLDVKGDEFTRSASGRITQAGGIATIKSEWRMRAAIDLLGDGKNEILFQGISGNLNGRISYWTMNGAERVGGGPLVPASVDDTKWRLVGCCK